MTQTPAGAPMRPAVLLLNRATAAALEPACREQLAGRAGNTRRDQWWQLRHIDDAQAPDFILPRRGRAVLLLGGDADADDDDHGRLQQAISRYRHCHVLATVQPGDARSFYRWQERAINNGSKYARACD